MKMQYEIPSFSTNIYAELRADVLESEYKFNDLLIFKNARIKFTQDDSQQVQNAVTGYIEHLEDKKSRIKEATMAVFKENSQDKGLLRAKTSKVMQKLARN
jgi:ribosomal protein S17E